MLDLYESLILNYFVKYIVINLYGPYELHIDHIEEEVKNDKIRIF